MHIFLQGIALIAGILLLCCTTGYHGDDDSDIAPAYTYKRPIPSSNNAEYVWTQTTNKHGFLIQ